VTGPVEDATVTVHGIGEDAVTGAWRRTRARVYHVEGFDPWDVGTS
jgi:hypothetical protein